MKFWDDRWSIIYIIFLTRDIGPQSCDWVAKSKEGSRWPD